MDATTIFTGEILTRLGAPRCLVGRTLSQELGRELLIHRVTNEPERWDRGYNGLLAIAYRACRVEKGDGSFGAMFTGDYDFASDPAKRVRLRQPNLVLDTANLIISEWLAGKRPLESMRYFGRLVRFAVIDQVRRSKRRPVLVGVEPEMLESNVSDDITPENQCVVCRKPLTGRADAKTCSPTCRKKLNRVTLSSIRDE